MGEIGGDRVGIGPEIGERLGRDRGEIGGWLDWNWIGIWWAEGLAIGRMGPGIGMLWASLGCPLVVLWASFLFVHAGSWAAAVGFLGAFLAEKKSVALPVGQRYWLAGGGV